MNAVPAGYSSDEDDCEYYTCDSFSTPNLPSSVKHNLQNEEPDELKAYRACIGGRIDEIKEILDRGYDVNSKMKDNWSLLLLASSLGSLEIVELLLNKGADINYKKNDGCTVLMAVSSCPMETSPYERSYNILKLLLNSGADPKLINKRRMTALMFAASCGNCLIVRELLKYDNKEVEDNQGWSALFWAVYSNQPEVVKILLEDGFVCDKMDIRGETPLQCALRSGYDEIVDLLPSLHLKSFEDFQCYTLESFDDFFNKGCVSFLSDICVLLFGMNSENAIDKFISSKITLLEFLCINEEKLKEIGVKMPYERYRILNGLFRFHKQPFRLKSIPIVKKNEEISLANVSTSIITSCRQFIVMNASLKYLIENSNINCDFEEFKSEILSLNDQIEKIERVVNVLNKRALLWDKENISPDLITSENLKKLRKSTWKRSVFKFGIVIGVVYFVIKSRGGLKII